MRYRSILGPAVFLYFGSLGCHADQIGSPVTLRPPTSVSKLVVVPEPAGNDGFLRGIHYFTGWRTPDPDYLDPNLSNSDAPNQYPWNDIAGNNWGGPPRQPLLDYYNDSQQDVSDRQILAMVDAGYDYVIYQMGWSHKKWGATSNGAFRDYIAYNHIASAYGAKLKFTVAWDDGNSGMAPDDMQASQAATNYWNDLGWNAATVNADYSALFTHWFRDFAANGNFYRYKNGRPVVFIFDPEKLRVPHLVLGGSVPTAQEIITLLRDVAAQYGFSGTTTPFVVAQNVGDAYVGDSLRAWGFDAHSGYVYENSVPCLDSWEIGPCYPQAEQSYRNKWSWALSKSSSNLEYWVPNANGRDSRPWSGSYNWTATSANFESLVRASMDTSAARWQLTGRNLISCCWNEWGEGAYIEPSTMAYGYSYRGSTLSDAHRRTVLGQAYGSNRMPEGWFDDITADGYAEGWGVDPDTPNQRIIVHLYVDGYYAEGGTFLTGGETDWWSDDINSAYGISGRHRFRIQLPTSACWHYIYIHLLDSSGDDQNPHLGGGPRYYSC